MSGDEKKKDMNTNEAPRSGDDRDHAAGEDGYRFMDQTIKKRPADRRTIVRKVLGIILSGAAIGAIAALVFALLQPAVSGMYGPQKEEAKVTIPQDEEPTPTPTPSPKPTAEPTPTAAPTPEETEEPAETGQPEETKEPEQPEETAEPGKDDTKEPDGPEEPDKAAAAEGQEETAEDTHVITLSEYRQLYQDMLAMAEESEKALVQVIGITDEMDYFNQNYENQQRVSGLIIARTDTDLYILTEYRVIGEVGRIQVVFADGAMTDATFQKADENTGLAVIKVSLANISEETSDLIATAPFGNSYGVVRGEPVLALGSPLGYTDSVAFGIVTSTSSKVAVVDMEYPLLTTDIDGSTGGSGILMDLGGAVVGVITHTGGSENGSITALAISQIKELMQDLSNNVPQNYIGIRGQDVTQDITDRTGIPRGVLVTEAVKDSPAMLAGIKEFDVIVKIGDEPVETIRDYHRIVSGLPADETVVLTAMRRGAEGFAEVTFEVQVDER